MVVTIILHVDNEGILEDTLQEIVEQEVVDFVRRSKLDMNLSTVVVEDDD